MAYEGDALAARLQGRGEALGEAAAAADEHDLDVDLDPVAAARAGAVEELLAGLRLGVDVARLAAAVIDHDGQRGLAALGPEADLGDALVDARAPRHIGLALAPGERDQLVRREAERGRCMQVVEHGDGLDAAVAAGILAAVIQLGVRLRVAGRGEEDEA